MKCIILLEKQNFSHLEFLLKYMHYLLTTEKDTLFRITIMLPVNPVYFQENTNYAINIHVYLDIRKEILRNI